VSTMNVSIKNATNVVIGNGVTVMRHVGRATKDYGRVCYESFHKSIGVEDGAINWDGLIAPEKDAWAMAAAPVILEKAENE